MQISTVAPNAPYVPTPVVPGTPLGVVDVKRRVDAFLFAGDQLGQKQGYASLRNAIVALQRLTAGDAAAGFVTHDKGRFFTHQLATAERAHGAELGAYHLGRTWRGERGVRVLPGVLAVVDGAALVRNDSDATRISEGDLKRRVFFD